MPHDALTPARRWAILGVLCAIYMVAFFDRISLSVSLTVPDFKQFFALDDHGRGALNSAFFWSYALLQIPAGWLVDRFGAKRSIAVGFVLWSLTAAGTGLSQTFAQLFSMRLLLGVGESVITPAGLSWIRFNFPEHRRGLAIGLFMAAAKVGPGIGAFVVTGLLQRFGWRSMFPMLGVGGLVFLVPWLLLVESKDRATEAGQLQARQTTSVSFKAIARSPVLWGTLIGTFCYQYFVYFCMTWMPAYLVERRHLSHEAMAFITMFSFLGMALVATAAGWAADALIARGGDPVKVRKRFAIAGLLLGSTELIGAFATSPTVALVFAIASLSGLGLMTANYWALTQTLIPGGAVGRIVGIQNCAANLPGIVAPLVTGWLIQKTGNYQAPMAVIGGLLFIAVMSYVFLVRREHAPKDAATGALAG